MLQKEKLLIILLIINLSIQEKSEKIKIQKKDKNFYFQLTKNKNFDFQEIFYDNTKLERDNKYFKRYPLKNPIILDIPKKTKNILVTFKNCKLPFICIKEKKSPYMRFLKNNKFVSECDFTNFDFLGLRENGGTVPQKIYDLNKIENEILEHSILSKKLDLKKNYKALFFCAIFKEKKEKILSFKIEFIDFHFFRTLDIYEEERNNNVLQNKKVIKITKNQGYLINFKNSLKNLKINFNHDNKEDYLIWLRYYKNKKVHVKFFKENIFEITEEINDLKIKIINFNEKEIIIDFLYKGDIVKQKGFEIEEEIEEDVFFIIFTLVSIIFCSLIIYIFWYKPNEYYFNKKFNFEKPFVFDEFSSDEEDDENEIKDYIKVRKDFENEKIEESDKDTTDYHDASFFSQESVEEIIENIEEKNLLNKNKS